MAPLYPYMTIYTYSLEVAILGWWSQSADCDGVGTKILFLRFPPSILVLQRVLFLENAHLNVILHTSPDVKDTPKAHETMQRRQSPVKIRLSSASLSQPPSTFPTVRGSGAVNVSTNYRGTYGDYIGMIIGIHSLTL